MLNERFRLFPPGCKTWQRYVWAIGFPNGATMIGSSRNVRATASYYEANGGRLSWVHLFPVMEPSRALHVVGAAAARFTQTGHRNVGRNTFPGVSRSVAIACIRSAMSAPAQAAQAGG